MAEVDPGDSPRLSRGSHAYRFRVDLFRLQTIFFASKAMAKFFDDLPRDYAQDPLSRLVEEYEEEEINRILISVSVMVRMKLDEYRDEENTTFGDQKEWVCGSLTKDLDGSPKEYTLDIREACNKLIHSRQFKFDKSDYEFIPYLKKVVHLRGERYGKKWKAEVNILDFIRYSAGILGS